MFDKLSTSCQAGELWRVLLPVFDLSGLTSDHPKKNTRIGIGYVLVVSPSFMEEVAVVEVRRVGGVCFQ